MSKRVAIYARYSTDRQNEASIETQVELCQSFIDRMGWQLQEIFSDEGISGTSYKRRPGIQNLLRRIKSRNFDVVLCVSPDRISRNKEHGNGFLARTDYYETELWSVQSGSRINDMEMGFSTLMSHELIKSIKYKTREGMKTSVRKGKATTCVPYGYRVKLAYDSAGERIRGLREINKEEAEIVEWIFLEYAKGKSPAQLAVDLNARIPAVPGPRGVNWRDTAIRGHVSRGVGILNNELYLGRMVWNRREFRKNPDTERREARQNDQKDWVVSEVPDLRIISNELWAKVKNRQKVVETNHSHVSTNKLNATHRPRYLLSGILECAHCGGPYSVMAKGRYGCTNRQKKLPIDELGGIVCTNSKTITRKELEKRVITAIPSNLFGTDNLEHLNKNIAAKFNAEQREASAEPAKLKARIAEITDTQKALGDRIAERIIAGQMHIPALDAKLDELEHERLDLANRLQQLPEHNKVPQTPPTINSAVLSSAISALKIGLYSQEQTHNALLGEREGWIDFMRTLIQKVVIAPSEDGQSADLTIYGRLASILAANEAWAEASQELRAQQAADFREKREAGSFKNAQEKLRYLNRFHAVLLEKEAEWKRLQVSVVAGAGFEPAAFRL